MKQDRNTTMIFRPILAILHGDSRQYNATPMMASIEQDFSMMFGDHVSGRFLARWSSDFKQRVITKCRSLPSNPYVDELPAASDLEVENDYDQNKTPKMSSAQAANHVAGFIKEGANLTTFLDQVDARQPFLLCIGEQKKKIARFFIVVNQKDIPCNTQTSVAAFDVLFKTHYVFSLSYDEALCTFYTAFQHRCWNHKGNPASQGTEGQTTARPVNRHQFTKVRAQLKKLSGYVHMFCL
ncbi:uncharacterized protein LOC125016563 isoform X2 [Mugil cephalus]|uniref:uncharacterized protein LOC125016563 isoform X2 n=1 Tax=Mugil cephalus TaxID=48193 RepID=UPI001FB68838|nr:uncharacterized protein LOC125016563 isoform X2 [Mugil cephalus]